MALGENRVKVVEATHDAKRRRETTLKQIASVWENLASEPVNDILVDLLSEEMVLLTGHNPNKEDVHYFISKCLTLNLETTQKRHVNTKTHKKRRNDWEISKAVLLGETLDRTSVSQTYQDVFVRLSQLYPQFCQEFADHLDASFRSGRKLLSKNKTEVTANQKWRNTVQLPNGYWLLVHSNTCDKCRWMSLACHVAGIRWQEDLIIEFFNRDGETAEDAFLHKIPTTWNS